MTTPEPTLRIARPDDAGALAALVRTAYRGSWVWVLQYDSHQYPAASVS